VEQFDKSNYQTFLCRNNPYYSYFGIQHGAEELAGKASVSETSIQLTSVRNELRVWEILCRAVGHRSIRWRHFTNVTSCYGRVVKDDDGFPTSQCI
jgi:hypothetical protein